VIDPIQILWQPAGLTMPALGSRALVDVTDGDTPNVRMPIRMLSVDTPEVTARSAARAGKVDEEFAELAAWIRAGQAPISAAYAAYLLPRIEAGAGTRQYTQGQNASAFMKARVEERLTRPGGERRSLFIRAADQPFDDNNRLLAYIAPNYSPRELASLPRRDRATFNFDLVESGWAATFVIFPSIPGELDLPLFIAAAAAAIAAGRGIWADPLTLLAYEYRAMEKLHAVTRRLVAGASLPPAERYGWRVRYCADMRDRRLHGPEDYVAIPPPCRLWIWPADVQDAVSKLNLVPAQRLVTPS
jgi:endonuclease YncB( thermonuclease family)